MCRSTISIQHSANTLVEKMGSSTLSSIFFLANPQISQWQGQILADSTLVDSLTKEDHLELDVIVCLDAARIDLEGGLVVDLRAINPQHGLPWTEILLQHAWHQNEDVCRAARRALFLARPDDPKTAEILRDSMARGGQLQLDALELCSEEMGCGWLKQCRILFESLVLERMPRHFLSRSSNAPKHPPDQLSNADGIGVQDAAHELPSILRQAVCDEDAVLRQEAIKARDGPTQVTALGDVPVLLPQAMRRLDAAKVTAQAPLSLAQCLEGDQQLRLWALGEIRSRLAVAKKRGEEARKRTADGGLFTCSRLRSK
eukprot:Skav222303  [mRNA]  locus=scaffold3734:321275:325125:- [translate_table: standard]